VNFHLQKQSNTKSSPTTWKVSNRFYTKALITDLRHFATTSAAQHRALRKCFAFTFSRTHPKCLPLLPRYLKWQNMAMNRDWKCWYGSQLRARKLLGSIISRTFGKYRRIASSAVWSFDIGSFPRWYFAFWILGRLKSPRWCLIVVWLLGVEARTQWAGWFCPGSGP